MFARTSTIMLGLVGAFALGLTIGPQLSAPRTVATAPARHVAPDAPAPAAPAASAAPRTAAPRLERVLPASAPPVRQRVERLLADGTDVTVAVDGFHNARQLMTVAYAARNTEIPFVVLKQRVLTERMSLSRAIRESRPDLDETAEVTRARAEARADLARIAS